MRDSANGFFSVWVVFLTSAVLLIALRINTIEAQLFSYSGAVMRGRLLSSEAAQAVARGGRPRFCNERAGMGEGCFVASKGQGSKPALILAAALPEPTLCSGTLNLKQIDLQRAVQDYDSCGLSELNVSSESSYFASGLEVGSLTVSVNQAAVVVRGNLKIERLQFDQRRSLLLVASGDVAVETIEAVGGAEVSILSRRGLVTVAGITGTVALRVSAPLGPLPVGSEQLSSVLSANEAKFLTGSPLIQGMAVKEM